MSKFVSLIKIQSRTVTYNANFFNFCLESHLRNLILNPQSQILFFPWYWNSQMLRISHYRIWDYNLVSPKKNTQKLVLIHRLRRGEPEHNFSLCTDNFQKKHQARQRWEPQKKIIFLFLKYYNFFKNSFKVYFIVYIIPLTMAGARIICQSCWWDKRVT